jgi:hypothetical protein
MLVKRFLFPLLLIGFFANCQKTQDDPPAPPPQYASTPQLFPLSQPLINEASGIADSYSHPGFLWVQEDGGNPAALRLLAHDGTVGGSVTISGAVNRDWEEMVMTSENGKRFIYVADIGDNNFVYDDYKIYRFEEPASNATTVSTAQTIPFRYDDGSHDAEAFLVDPSTKDIYIITKREAKSRVYRIAHPYSFDAQNTAEFLFELQFSGVVAAAMANSGKEIILKTYPALYHYTLADGETLEVALKKAGKQIGYVAEAQGEAIAFEREGKGFFTLSEKGLNVPVVLNYYPRQ